MGNAHSHAYYSIPSTYPEAGISPKLICVVDEDAAVAEAARDRWGYERCSTDWSSVVLDDRIDVIDITTPNNAHLEIALAAAGAGKHVYCEKPVGRSGEETLRIAGAVSRAGVMSFTGFNYRWMPALQQARQLILDGRLGEITHFRSVFLTDWGASSNARFSWRFDRAVAGWGVLGDLGSHIVDTAQFLVGPIDEVCGTGATFITDRPTVAPTEESRVRGASVFAGIEIAQTAARSRVTNEDYIAGLVKFQRGARGTLEGSRVTVGPKSRFFLELHGTRGAFSWDLERMNEFEVCLDTEDGTNQGYRRVVTGPDHPDFGSFSPGAGAGIAFRDSQTIEAFHFLRGITTGVTSEPSLETAARVAAVLEALERSSKEGRWQRVDIPDFLHGGEEI
jgi:predicted dehydrogenase